MTARSNRRRLSLERHRGFTLIEVMIAVLILGIGLLGFALLQTMNVRFSQSANYRTQATNLAYDLLDQMRANRLTAAQYTAATFTAGAGAGANCTRPVGTVSVAANIGRWQCQVAEALGEGASAEVTFVGGQAEVVLIWGDSRADVNSPTSTFAVRTRL